MSLYALIYQNYEEKEHEKETIIRYHLWAAGSRRTENRDSLIYQSTTFKYTTSEQMGRLFDLEENGYFLANSTNDAVAAKICELLTGLML